MYCDVIYFFCILLDLANRVKMQVIALTEELLETAKQNEVSGTHLGTGASASPGYPEPQVNRTVNYTSLLSFCICWETCSMLLCREAVL